MAATFRSPPEHVGGLDGVAAQDADAGVVRLHQRIDEGQHLEIVEGGDDHVHALLLQPAGQRLEIGGLVVEGFAHGDLAPVLRDLRRGPVGQPPCRTACRRRARHSWRRPTAWRRTNPWRAPQGVVRDEPEGAGQPQLREARVGGDRQLRHALDGVDGRGFDADTGIQVAHHGHHARFDQLLRHGLARGSVRAVVLCHHFQRDALAVHHEAGLVEFVHRHLHAIEHILPQRRERARQRLGHADLHRVRHAAAAPSASAAAHAPASPASTARRPVPAPATPPIPSLVLCITVAPSIGFD